jgi:hypothetical protein
MYGYYQPFLFASCVKSGAYNVYVVDGRWNKDYYLMYVSALRRLSLHNKREGVGRKRQRGEYGIGRIMLGHVINLI